MARIGQLLKTVADNSALPQLDYATLIAAGYAVPEFIEDGAVGDWCFDTAASSVLTSKNSTEVLTPQGTAPTYSANYLTIPATGQNGLATTVEDAQALTYMGVVKFPASNPTAALVVAHIGGQTEGQGGEFLFISSSGALTLQVRGSSSDPLISSVNLVAAGIDPGDWFFFAVTSEDAGGGDTSKTLFVGAPSPVTDTESGAKVLANVNNYVALGNANITTTNYDEMALDAHRFIVAQRTFTVAELTEVYARAKIVASRRSLTIV